MVLAPIFYFLEFIFTPFFSPKLRFAPFLLSILCQNRNFSCHQNSVLSTKNTAFLVYFSPPKPEFCIKLRISVHFAICNFMHFALRFDALLCVFWWF